MRRFVPALVCLCTVAALAAPAAMAAAEPVVSTGNATAITSTSATLNGTVNPEGQATTYSFEYGTTTSYGSQTATTSAGSATAGVKASAAVASLAPNTTYHYRLVATNASGTTLGSDVSFKTPKPPVPVVATGHPKDVTQTSATLTGTVDPEGQATSYAFQYGTNTAYGNQTPAASAGSGTKTVSVRPRSERSFRTRPTTTGSRRTSVNGTTYGHDISFKTARPPSGSHAWRPVRDDHVRPVDEPGRAGAGPAAVPPDGHPAERAECRRTLGRPGAATASASTGAYSFPGVAPSANTYYRALSDGATSATVLVSVSFRVGIFVSRLHPLRGTTVRFHGRVGPRHNGLHVLVQWLGPRGHWNTIKPTRLRGAGGGLSFYSVRVRIERSGRYRVVVVADSTHATGLSATVRIRAR